VGQTESWFSNWTRFSTFGAAGFPVKLSLAELIIVAFLTCLTTGCTSSASSQPPADEASSKPAEDASKTSYQWNPVECWIAEETWWLPRSVRESHGCRPQ